MTEAGNPEEERLERLVRDHHPAVVAYVRRRVRPEAVDDIVAETFLVAWRRLDHVPAEAAPWLIGVARNVVRTQRRAAGRRETLHERLRAQSAEPGHDSPAADQPALEALSRLSERDREALTLVAWDGLAPREAALALGVPATTFHVRLHRAKRRFRRELDALTSRRHPPVLGKEAIHD